MELISIIASLANLFIAGGTVMIFCIVKFNDLKHIQESLERIERNQTMIWEKLDKTTERVSCVEGKIGLLENKK